MIAEKPGAAKTIAEVIGADVRKKGYFEGAGYIVSWCVGHLIGLAAADIYDERYSKWAKEDLPILPEQWKFNIFEETKEQFEVLKYLMNRSDVANIINACDAGREGEFIFRLLYDKAGCMKPFKRLWISSMEEDTIRKGFKELKNGKDYDDLYEAALCRAKADWLVGINFTRLFTTLYRGKTLNIGRVMTPTLAVLTEREKEISEFKKEKFYTVELDLGGFNAKSERIKSKTDAERLRKLCIGKPAVIKEINRREISEKPPELYDLTALQKEANRRYGYTAQQTLDYIQALYEGGLTTYPRTDSNYLTESMADSITELYPVVLDMFSFDMNISEEMDAKRVICDSKVTDHHAILPTQKAAQDDISSLPSGERNILKLIAKQFLCAVCPYKNICEYMTLILECEGKQFISKCSMEVEEGWKKIERAFEKTLKHKAEAEMVNEDLPELSEGEVFTIKAAKLNQGVTKSPDRFTEASLLSAMENAGSNDSGDIERKGIGTSATRAGIIEKLVKNGFVERKERQLIPTKQGMELINILPDAVSSAEMTAKWESELKEIEKAERKPEDFMMSIEQMVKDIVKSYENVNVDNSMFMQEREIIGSCPRCGKPVYESKKSFFCSGYKDDPSCGFALWKNNPYFRSKRKELTKKTVSQFLKTGRVNMTELYSEKKGIFYDAAVVMEDSGEGYVNFRLEFDDKEKIGRQQN